MRILRVIILDDDPKFLAVAKAALASAKYSVTTASGFEEAAAALRKFRGKAVVLSELTVGNQNGLQFLADTLRNYPMVPFTFLASAPPLESVIEALKQGAYDFLRKPVDPGILRHSVARSMEKLNLSLETEKQDQDIRILLSGVKKELQRHKTIGGFKGFLIATTAHDLRSVLTVLDGYHQIIKEKCEGCRHPVSMPMLDLARRSIYRLRNMATMLLDNEAAERGQFKIERVPFQLDDVLRESAEFYGPYAAQKGIDLSAEEGIPSLKVLGDPGRVAEVLDNVLYNAVKFTSSGGRIRIGARADGNKCATAWVEDNGAGIPKQRQKKLFDMKELASRKDGPARIGLGLRICRNLIEAQEGKIWIESAPGKGTKVFFTIPM